MTQPDDSAVETARARTAVSGPNEAPVDLETYASMCAEIDAGVPQADVLAKKGIAEDVWAKAHAHWLRRMNDEAERKRFQVTTRYHATFKAKRSVFDARLRRERARDQRAKVLPPPTSAMDAADAELRVPLVSSLPALALPDAPPRIAPVPIRSPSPAPMPAYAHAPPRAPSPFPPAVAPMQSPLLVTAPPAGSMPSSVTYPPSTARPGSQPPASMPFKPPAAGFQPPREERSEREPTAAPRSEAAPETKPAHLYATMGVDWSSVNLDALPFQGEAGAPTTKPTPKVTSQVSTPWETKPTAEPGIPFEPPPRKQNELAQTGTIDPDIIARAMRGAMPFSKPTPPPSPVVSAVDRGFPDRGSPDRGFPDRGSPDEADVDSTRTQALPPEKARSALELTTPSRPEPPAPPPASPKAEAFRFPINVFASLTAEIAESPRDAAAIRGRYAISEAAHHEESLRWTDAFAKDPALRDRYLGIVKRYRAYLQNPNKK